MTHTTNSKTSNTNNTNTRTAWLYKKNLAALTVLLASVSGLAGLSACTSEKTPQAGSVQATTIVDSSGNPNGNPDAGLIQDGNAVRAQSSGSGPAVQIRNGAITVRGFGKKGQAPDQVTITMGVETQGANAAAALKENNSRAAELIKLLKDNGVEDRFVQTSQLSIYPRFDDKGQRVIGYQVSNIVTATLKDVKAAGGVIDAAASAAGDAIRIQGLSFGLSDSSESVKVARERAVADAKLQAEQLSAAAGVKLGKLVSISTASVGVPSAVLNQNVEAKALGDAASVPLEGGSQDVTAEVIMVWEIA